MDSSVFLEIQKLIEKIKNTKLPPALFQKAAEYIERIQLSLNYGGNISQIDVISKYIDWITSLPWDKQTEDTLDIKKAEEVMEKNHYGLTAVKLRILEYLSTLILQKQNTTLPPAHAPILLLVGLAGTGKTTFAKSIAESLGRKFARIPFGGLSSVLDLRGLSKIQSEAEPGLIIKILKQVQCRNPIILLDELDRIVPESRGAINGVLIELLDPEQNNLFTDHYIDYPFDLSQVIFVATANTTNNISTALMDRLEVIQMPSYTDEEKIVIVKNYILPRLLKESGISSENLIIENSVFKKIARSSGYDPGIRSIERYVEIIVRKVNFRIVNKKGSKFTINEENLQEYLE